LGYRSDGLLRYFNNFIANQLFLTLGAPTERLPRRDLCNIRTMIPSL